MSRPRYESADSLEAEKRIKEHLEKAWGASLHAMPISYGMDYCVEVNGKVKGVCEIKRRRCNKADFQTLFIALQKVMKAHQFLQVNIHPVLVIGWNDAVGLQDLGKWPEYVDYSGRTVQTRDSADVEPMAHYPVSGFINPREFSWWPYGD